MTTAGNAHADVDAGEFVKADDEERFVDLEAEDFGLSEGKRLAVDFDETFALFAVCDSRCSLFLAEALHTLGRRHDGFV